MAAWLHQGGGCEGGRLGEQGVESLQLNHGAGVGGQPVGPVRQAKQPVRGHPQGRRTFRRDLGIGQPGRSRFLQLRHGGPINANRTGQRALRHAPGRHRLGQSGAKQLCPQALVHFILHLFIIIPDVAYPLPIFRIPLRLGKW